MLHEFVELAESGVQVYLMHLDVEEEIKKLTEGTHIMFAELYDDKSEV